MEKNVRFRSIDDVVLDGTLAAEKKVPLGTRCAVFVHGGGGVDRNEDGYFRRFAKYLSDAEIPNLRFDNRTYIATKNKRVETTISGVVSDVVSAVRFAKNVFNIKEVHLIGASFSGGATLMAARVLADSVRSVTLINPLIHYRERLLDQKDYWAAGQLTEKGAAQLRRRGWLPHGSALRMGRCIISEAAWFDVGLLARSIAVPIQILHGTNDSRIPIQWSQKFAQLSPGTQLVEFTGAEHGLCSPGDDNFSAPDTLRWHAQSFKLTQEFIQKSATN